VGSNLYITLVELMASRMGGIVTGELYAPGDFMYTNAERALALDFALLRLQLKESPFDVTGLSLQFNRILEETLAAGIREHGSKLSVENILAVSAEFGDRYFYDDHWMERLLPDLISIITGQPCFSASSKRQSDLRSGLILLLAYDLQMLHWSLINLFEESHDMVEIAEERAQMNALFQYRYGCVSLADVGLASVDEAPIKIKPFMLPVKRIFDIVVTLTLCLVISPLLLFLMLVLAFSDAPIFYSQRRIGRNGRIFRCQKFSTMVPNAEKLLAELIASDPEVHAEWQQYEKLRNDPRITKLGRFLRQTSLDELPQLFNVLKGDMSLVGPRPMAVHERERWGGLYRSYTAVRPGVTGPWQILHRTDSDYQSRMNSLEHYLHHWSVLADVKYLLMTLFVPFSGRGAY